MSLGAKGLLAHKRLGVVLEATQAPPDPDPDPDPDPPTSLLGVGSSSNSLTLYPKSAPRTVGNYYVSPTGSDSNAGTSLASPFRTIQRALQAVSSGQTIIVRAGTYTGAINRNTNWSSTVRVFAYGTERPVINAGSGTALNFTGSSRNEHWYGFDIRGGSTYGIRLEGRDITIENCWVNRCAQNQYGAGIFVGQTTGSNALIQDCAVFRLGDGYSGGTNTPDGIVFTSAPGTLTNNHRCVRCFVANTTDDGIDLYRATNTQIIDCAILGGGYYWNGTAAGEGHGTKMGGNTPGPNLIRGTIAAHCRQVGLNANGAPNITWTNNTSVSNYVGMAFRAGASSHVATNNLVTHCNTTYTQTPGSQSNNSWQVGVSNSNVAYAAPASGDYSLAASSFARGKGTGGQHLGASTIALELLKSWWNHPDVYRP